MGEQHENSKSMPRSSMYASKWQQVSECAPNAVARAIEPREVEFVCKPPRDRDVKEWVRKAEKRQTVTELNSQQKTFSATVEPPAAVSGTTNQPDDQKIRHIAQGL